MAGRNSFLSVLAGRRPTGNLDGLGSPRVGNFLRPFISLLPVQPEHQVVVYRVLVLRFSRSSWIWTTNDSVWIRLYDRSANHSRALSLGRTRPTMVAAAAVLFVGEYAWLVANRITRVRHCLRCRTDG